jgi:apolipoprotein N-acyltransferase
MSNLTLAPLSALLLVLSFPAFDLAFLTWIALVPLLLAVSRQNLWGALFSSWLAGIGFFMGHCYWMNEVPGFRPIDFTVCGIYLGSYLGMFGLAYAFLLRRTRLPPAVLVPPLWVTVEYLRAHVGFLGVPWGLLGHTQYENPLLMQIASWTGVYGLSFLIALVNAAIVEMVLPLLSTSPEQSPGRVPPLALATVLFGLLGVSLLYGVRTVAIPLQAETVRVTVLQGNVPQALKWRPEYRRLSLETYSKLTKEAVAATGATSLIVWPETSVPGSLTQDLGVMNTVTTLVKEVNTPLLIGSLQRPRFGAREFRQANWLNNALLVSPTPRIIGQYAKIHLLPFGEYLPYKDILPWPPHVAARLEKDALLPGTEYRVFDLEGKRFSVLICWESLFPELARRFVQNGAEFLINMTNEAWFGDTAAPRQFLAMNVFRAVENRTVLIRAANTGISGVIDPYGRILGRVQDHSHRDTFVSGYLTETIPLSRERTFYTTHGDVWAYLNIIFVTAFFTLAVLRQRV